MSAPVTKIGGLAEELRVNLNHCRSERMLNNWVANFRRQMLNLTVEQYDDLTGRASAVERRLCPQFADMAVWSFNGGETRTVKETSL